MKSASISIIGRPSSGKSTLVNTICERKVSITAQTPQTTRNAIRGIYTDQRGQLILTDTPGYHLNDQKFNLKLQQTALKALDECDLVLYIVDATRSGGKEESAIIEILKQVKRPVVAAVNKTDIASAEQVAETKAFITDLLDTAALLQISASADEGVDDLLIELFRLSPEGPLHYGEEEFTDQPLEFRVSEIIREKAIQSVSQEIPHAIFVEVIDIEHDEENKSIWIRAAINVEKESQKGILVGRGGANIKKIRVAAFKEIKQIFPTLSLTLDLRVKAVSRWRRKDMILSKIL
ncbi:MAG: GTPase Era [Sphaerochaetaceae bacterium]|nr:GTPase Era [Sphaerochaetaceae bacterium]